MAAGSCPALNLPRCEPTPGPRYEWEGCRGCSWGASVCRGWIGPCSQKTLVIKTGGEQFATFTLAWDPLPVCPTSPPTLVALWGHSMGPHLFHFKS